MTNDELNAAWRRKLPNVEPTERDLSAFALGVETGAALAAEQPQPDPVLRTYDALHYGRTEPHPLWRAVQRTVNGEDWRAVVAEMAEQPQPEAPSGWRMVPVEPTPEMIEAGWRAGGEMLEGRPVWKLTGDVQARLTYQRMLEAAPPPAAPVEVAPAPEVKDDALAAPRGVYLNPGRHPCGRTLCMRDDCHDLGCQNPNGEKR